MSILKFSAEFTSKCYHAFQYSTNIRYILEKLEKNDDVNLRSLLDEAIDELQREINQVIGDGEESIHNVRVKTLVSRQECWTELLDLIEQAYESRGLLSETRIK